MKIDIFFYAHNQDKYIKQGLESISLQIIPENHQVRLLCIDDGSSDDSVAIFESWIRAAKADPKTSNWDIEFRSRDGSKPRGQTETLLEGLSWTQGDYLAVLEGDDFWLTANHIQNLINGLQGFPFAPAIFSSWVALDETFQLVESRTLVNSSDVLSYLVDTTKLLDWNPPATLSACMYRGEFVRKVLDEVKGFKIFADWGLNLHMSKIGPLIWSPEVSLVYRNVSTSIWRSTNQKEKNVLNSVMLRDYSRNFDEPMAEIFRKRSQLLIQEPSFTQKVKFSLRHPVLAIRLISKRLIRKKIQG